MTHVHFGPRYRGNIVLKCARCGVPFQTNSFLRRTCCSRACDDAHRREKRAAWLDEKRRQQWRTTEGRE